MDLLMVRFKGNKPTNTNLFEFNVVRNHIQDNEHICFVENENDTAFYKNINNTYLEHSQFSVGVKTEEDDEYYVKKNRGKESVIRAFLKIEKDLNSELRKCIFIVDKDYEGVYSSKSYLSEEERSKFTTTSPVYSIENYFFIEENLQKVFNICGLSDNDYKSFKLELDQFIAQIREYTILNRVFTMANMYCEHQDDNIVYERTTGNKDDIFKFDFSKTPCFKLDVLNEKVIQYKQRLRERGSSKSNSYFKSLYGEKVDFNSVRGHFIWDFFENYLKQKYDIDISPRIKVDWCKYKVINNKYINLVKQINVNIEIKDGTGTILT